MEIPEIFVEGTFMEDPVLIQADVLVSNWNHGPASLGGG